MGGKIDKTVNRSQTGKGHFCKEFAMLRSFWNQEPVFLYSTVFFWLYFFLYSRFFKNPSCIKDKWFPSICVLKNPISLQCLSGVCLWAPVGRNGISNMLPSLVTIQFLKHAVTISEVLLRYNSWNMLLQYQKTCYDTIHETCCYNIRCLVTIQFLKCCYYIRSHVTIQFLKHNVEIFDPQSQFSQYVPAFVPF